MIKYSIIFFIAILSFYIYAQYRTPPHVLNNNSENIKPKIQKFYDIKLNDIYNNPLDLSQFKGRPILFVNVASRCGFTKQYRDLEALHNQYKDQGLIVIGIPCNDFGNQESGSAEDIIKFCKSTYDVSFLLTEKLSSKKSKRHPLFTYLIESNPELKGRISWNFNKFIVDPNGSVIAQFGSRTNPLDDSIISNITPFLTDN